MINPLLKKTIINNFEIRCAEAIQSAFDKMVTDGRYQVEWEEDNITICLVQTIKEIGDLARLRISVNYQPPIYDASMAFGGADPLRAPRVDFKFSKFFGPNEYDYYAEAKNLSEQDWVKTNSGTKVQASHYRARYVDTGIKNYLSGRYPSGCLVGYVVNGTVANIVVSLNRLIRFRKATNIGQINKDGTLAFSICYYSDNQSTSGPLRMRHLMLQLA